MPRVAILGAGCIGQWIGGHLCSGGCEVLLVGRGILQRSFDAGTLKFTDIERDADGFELKLPFSETAGLEVCFDVEQALKADNFDVVFVCLKMNDNKAASALGALKKSTVFVSLQNGVGNQHELGKLLPEHRVLAGMIPSGVVEVDAGYFRRGSYGEMAFDDRLPEFVIDAFGKSGLGVEVHNGEEMVAVQWGKLILNLGNALNALVGQPVVDCMADRSYRQLLATIWKEGLAVVKAKGIPFKVELNGKPLERVVGVMGMPSFLVSTVQRMQGLKMPDPTYRSSMYYDLALKRQTEVDELNGKIVALTADLEVRAPVNELVVQLVHEAQQLKAGSPEIPIDTLFARAAAVAPELNSGGCLIS